MSETTHEMEGRQLAVNRATESRRDSSPRRTFRPQGSAEGQGEQFKNFFDEKPAAGEKA